jgi:hypothetical protein
LAIGVGRIVGSYSELSSPTVMWLTAGAVFVSLGALVLVAIRL